MGAMYSRTFLAASQELAEVKPPPHCLTEAQALTQLQSPGVG